MIRLRVLAILLAAVAATGALAAPAAARIDVVQTALRALRVAERAEKAAKRNKLAKVDTTRLVDGGVGSADLAEGAVTAGNVRDGEAFVLVKRKDHELHIYGTGKDRRVIVSRHQPDGGTTAGDGATGGKTPDDAPAAPATGGATAPSGEQS